MICAFALATTIAAVPAPCEDLPGERAALLRAASGDAHFGDMAASLDQRFGAPLAAGIRLDGPPEEAAAALADRLEELCARATATGIVAVRPGDREALEAILARPEFAQARAPDVDGLSRLAAWLTAWMDALFETSGAQSFARGTRVLILALALAVVLGVAFRLAAMRRKGVAPESGEGSTARAARPLDSPETHLARAGTVLEADPREAIREGLFALLSSLERRALARPDRVKTNREIAEQLTERGAPPRVSEQVRALLGWYDRTYYSMERPTPPDARRFLDDVGELARSLREEPA